MRLNFDCPKILPPQETHESKCGLNPESANILILKIVIILCGL